MGSSSAGWISSCTLCDIVDYITYSVKWKVGGFQSGAANSGCSRLSSRLDPLESVSAAWIGCPTSDPPRLWRTGTDRNGGEDDALSAEAGDADFRESEFGWPSLHVTSGVALH